MRANRGLLFVFFAQKNINHDKGVETERDRETQLWHDLYKYHIINIGVGATETINLF